MGIKGLWKILEPTIQAASLTEISIREGFEKNRHGTGTIVVGVDVSPLFYAAQAVFANSSYSHAQSGTNPELRALFFRLAWLSRSGVSAVFVFDGPNRPRRKRNKAVRSTPNWMTDRFKEIVVGFGFHVHIAPGEAEAELARLNVAQAIDVILTSDSDVFLFGATQVIRNPSDSRHLDNINIYTADAFEHQHNQLFTAPGFFLMAVLSGGDYDTTGLPHCGPSIASALASGPLAISLYNAAKNLSGIQLDQFIAAWRSSLQNELVNDPAGRLGRKYVSIATNMPATFPNAEILKLYCSPIISAQVPNNVSTWLTPCVPNTAELATICEQLFHWGPDIVDRFISNVWDGYFIRKFIFNSFIGTFIPQGPPSLTTPTINCIVKTSGTRLQTGSEFDFYQVVLWIPSLVAEAASAVLASARPGTLVHNLTSANSMHVWIPAPILRATNEDLITAYHVDNPWVVSLEPFSKYTPVLEEFELMA